MDLDELRRRIAEEIVPNVDKYVRVLPENTEIYSIADVPPPNYSPMFTSGREARLNASGENMKYFAETAESCAAELGITGVDRLETTVFEVHRTTGPITGFDFARFPDDLKEALYAVKGDPPAKWVPMRTAINELRKHGVLEVDSAIFAPSASGEMLQISGFVFGANPAKYPIETVATGEYPKYVSGDRSVYILSSLD